MYGRPSDVRVFIHEQHRIVDRTVSRNGVLCSSVRARSEQNEERLLHRQLRCVRRLDGDDGHFIVFKMEPPRSDQSKAHESQGRCRRATVAASLAKHLAIHHSPPPSLSCPETALASRYGALFGFEALELNPLGNWIRYAWKHAGADACLDDASEYAYMSMLSFRGRDADDAVRICLKGRKALRSLQAAVDCASEQRGNENLVVAVMLHYAAEVRRGAFCSRPQC